MSQYIGNDPQGNLPVRNIYATNKNYIINPTFSVNQRGFAGTAIGGMGYDRWQVTTTQCSVVDANGFVTLTGSAAVPATHQRVEDFGYAEQVTVSWEGTAKLNLFVENGDAWDTGGLTSPHTFNLIAGLSSITDVKTLVGFYDGTLKNVKLEIGSTQTPFEYPEFGEELAKCLRYYTASSVYMNNSGGAGGTNRNGHYLQHEWAIPMRTTPAIVVSSFVSSDVTATFNAVSISTPKGIYQITTTASVAFGRFSFNYTADAEL